MKDPAITPAERKTLAELITSVSDSLRTIADILGGSAVNEEPAAVKENESVGETAPGKTELPAEPVKDSEPEEELKIEDIRPALVELSRARGNDAVRALFEKYGCGKLSELAPEHYADILKETEAILGA